jgi:class 3 adenylate cyclase
MSVDFEHALTQKESQLQLVLALDHVRDTLHDDGDPHNMFDALAHALKEHLNAEACAIMLVAETSDDVEAIAYTGLPEPIALQLCNEAINLEKPSAVTTSGWRYSLGLRIILHDFPLGAVVVARSNQPFDEADIALLALAESQLDSAVVQARTIWKLTQRNRELQAIFEIDRLRDTNSNELDLINGFTAVMLKHFGADFCLILLSNAETGEVVIRGMIDKHELSATVLQEVRNAVRDLKFPQVIPTPAGVDALILLAAPFIVAGERLGGIVVGRETKFTVGDHRLLHAMISQMDSAVVFSRTNLQLAQRKQELETIYRIDRIRDREKDLDAMLQAVLTELCGVAASEMGYILLYGDGKEVEGKEKELELRSVTMDGIVTSTESMEVVHRVSRKALDVGEMVYSNEPEGGVKSIIAVPLILNERIIGVFGVVNSIHSNGFDAEDRRLLSAITSQIDTAIFERMENRRMRSLLSRSVDPKVLEHLLQNAKTNVLAGERVVMTVLFADLRGSTEWAERTEPEELVRTLNAFLGQMTDVIFKYGGTLDKFVGDEVIGLFGTPVHMEDHAYRAASAALEMQKIQKELQITLSAQGHELPAMGVGVSSGEAIAGEFGHPVRSDFTALGRIVNLGSRLCGAAAAGQILISGTTFEMIEHLAQARKLEPMAFKGISQPAPVYELTSVQKGL